MSNLITYAERLFQRYEVIILFLPSPDILNLMDGTTLLLHIEISLLLVTRPLQSTIWLPVKKQGKEVAYMKKIED